MRKPSLGARLQRASVAFLLVAATSLWADEAALPVPKTTDELHAQLQELAQKHHTPGISFAVFDGDGVRFSGEWGVKTVASAERVTAATRFQIGSITKMVTAIAVLQLVEQGRFTLDTPVTKLLPSAPIVNPYEEVAPVTVGHLLSHTAGFDDMHFKAFLTDHETRGGHLDIALNHPEPYFVRWQPGRYHSYSNPGYVLLGAILEAHYHQPWDTIVEHHVLQPLGMNEVQALTSKVLEVDHAEAHRDETMTPVGVKHQLAQADGALWSSARQLAELGRFMLTDGASHRGVLRPETVRLMKQPFAETAKQAGLHWGYGLGAYSRDIDGRAMVGHTGGVIGALAGLSWLADGSAGYVVLTNSDVALRAFEKPLARFIQPELPSALETTTPVAVEGWFRVVNSRNEILRLAEYLVNVAHIKAVDKTLAMEAVIPGTGSVTWLPRGGHLMADADSPTITNAALLHAETGEIDGILLDDSYMERVSAWSAIAPVVSFIVALLLLVSAPFGRRHALQNRWLRRLPTMALGLLVLGVVAALNFSIETVMTVNWASLSVWLVTACLPMVALAGVATSLLNWSRESAKLAKWRCLLGSLGALTLSAWFAAFHWFALAIWAW